MLHRAGAVTRRAVHMCSGFSQEALTEALRRGAPSFWSDGTPGCWVMSSEYTDGRGWLVRECLLQFVREGKTKAADLTSDDACWDQFTQSLHARTRNGTSPTDALMPMGPAASERPHLSLTRLVYQPE